jgi:Ca-activated chloride channel family protein
MTGLRLLAGIPDSRNRVLVLVTDGQVGNEDQILNATSALLSGIRVHVVGIDQAVNAGFLGRLAAAGGGRCELVESERRLDAAMAAIQRRIAAPLVTGIRLESDAVVADSVNPRRLPDLFSGVPYVVRGRYRGTAPEIVLTGRTPDGRLWRASAPWVPAGDSALRPAWARASIRDLEDDYASAPSDELERRIVDTSLRFGVLSRFTASVAVDSRVGDISGELHRIVQPVELPAGWAPMAAVPLSAGGAFRASAKFGLSAPGAPAPGPQRLGRMAGRTVRRRKRTCWMCSTTWPRGSTRWCGTSAPSAWTPENSPRSSRCFATKPFPPMSAGRGPGI